jgi:antitoxin YefM
MERVIGVEEARGKLGQLIEEVASGDGPVVLAKRGRVMGVLISRDEYTKLRQAAAKVAWDELERRLEEVRERVDQAGLDPSAIDEAIDAARRVS